MEKDKRVSATCPICHEGELRRIDGPDEWYVPRAATLGLPDDQEKRVGRGVPVGISVCSRCEYVALFLPPAAAPPSQARSRCAPARSGRGSPRSGLRNHRRREDPELHARRPDGAATVMPFGFGARKRSS